MTRRSDYTPLWQRFHREGCPEARTALIEAHAALVPLTRRRMYPNPPAGIEGDDLESEGNIALIHAVDRFAPARGVGFVTYAVSKIRWAMVEHLRREDWVPRHAREAQRRLVTAYQQVAVAGLTPNRATLMTALGLNEDEYDRLEQDGFVWALISLEELFTAEGEPDPLYFRDRLIDPAPGPESRALEAAEHAALWRAVAALPPQYPELFTDYYRERVTFRELAARIDRSETRISQMHAYGLAKLRERSGAAVGVGP